MLTEHLIPVITLQVVWRSNSLQPMIATSSAHPILGLIC